MQGDDQEMVDMGENKTKKKKKNTKTPPKKKEPWNGLLVD